jgi:hypothetical protein
MQKFRKGHESGRREATRGLPRLSGVCALAATLMGCASDIQTTSGQDYLGKYQAVPLASSTNTSGFGGRNIDQMVRDAASVEPVLKFPARIGLARIDNGRLSAIPEEEAGAWKQAQEKLGSGFGEFVPLNPMVTEMVVGTIRDQRGYFDRGIDGVVTEIRLGAARQHLDAVLIYEEHSKDETNENALSVAKLTIIGGFLLPSESHTAQGFADGTLIDVIQGYPYGNIHTVVDKQSQLSSAWGWGSGRDEQHQLSEQVKIQAGKQLAEEASGMFIKLRMELAERRAK